MIRRSGILLLLCIAFWGAGGDVYAEKMSMVYHIKNFESIDLVQVKNERGVLLHEDRTHKPDGYFSMEADAPQIVYFYINDTSDYQEIWLEKGTLECTFSVGVHGVKFFDSAINRDHTTIQRAIKWQYIQWKRLESDYNYISQHGNAYRDSLSHLRFRLEDARTEYRVALLQELPKYLNSYLRLYYINEYVNDFRIERQLIYRSFQLCDASLQKYALYDSCKAKIDRAEYQLHEQESLPQLVLKNDADRYILLNDVLANRKWTYIDVWASFCAPCRKANLELKQLYNQYQDKVNFISYSADTDLAKWKQAIAGDAMPWLQVTDGKGRKSPVLSLFNIYSYPAGVLIDPDGKVVKVNFPLRELKTYLEKL